MTPQEYANYLHPTKIGRDGKPVNPQIRVRNQRKQKELLTLIGAKDGN